VMRVGCGGSLACAGCGVYWWVVCDARWSPGVLEIRCDVVLVSWYVVVQVCIVCSCPGMMVCGLRCAVLLYRVTDVRCCVRCALCSLIHVSRPLLVCAPVLYLLWHSVSVVRSFLEC
jgi:hypothetical protein